MRERQRGGLDRPPKESDASYPYALRGYWEFLKDKSYIETFVLAAAMGAATSIIRFTTFVLKLPIRPPVLVAHQASSIACPTSNRLDLGVWLSPWPEDFAAMGVPWSQAGRAAGQAGRPAGQAAGQEDREAGALRRVRDLQDQPLAANENRL
ncbi:LLM class flavin-dependent oxidoreductase [Nonomuraea sp. NPDC049655]|uniref:LLM class flavin-dependent oxidoreductase n=1 Tax=Nonomuraea sp. NPDC049655 TaxID=3364355 RepID=UPI0037B131CF